MLKTMSFIGDCIGSALETIGCVIPDFDTDIRESVHERLVNIRERLDRTRDNSSVEVKNTTTDLTPEEIDAEAIRSDWMAVGNDLREAMKSYAKQSS